MQPNSALSALPRRHKASNSVEIARENGVNLDQLYDIGVGYCVPSYRHRSAFLAAMSKGYLPSENCSFLQVAQVTQRELKI